MADVQIYPRQNRTDTAGERRDRVESLETRTGALPEWFRTFLIRHGGGFPWPQDVKISDPALCQIVGEDIVAVFELYDLDTIEAHLNGAVYGSATPRPYLFTADAQGGLHVLLSLRPDDFGALFLWPHTSLPWGPAEEERLIPFLPDFPALIDSLRDLPGSEVARQNWDRGPRRDEAVRIDL